MSIDYYGDVGVYIGEDNMISFQTGHSKPFFSQETNTLHSTDLFTNSKEILLNIKGVNVLSRGANNQLPKEVEELIGNNRLLPELMAKQTRILYGKGPHVYLNKFKKGRLIREWSNCTPIQDWLESWELKGLQSYKQFCRSAIQRYYTHEDYFVKWRFNRSRRIKQFPVAGLELIDNKRARLATNKRLDPYLNDIDYNAFNHILVGNWLGGFDYELKKYKRFSISDPYSNRVAISHHRNESSSSHYGVNKIIEGTKQWISGSNNTPTFINSYLNNSFASNVHVIIPAEWLKLKRDMIERLCEENVDRLQRGEQLTVLRDRTSGETIELGVEYQESYLIKYTNMEIKKLSKYLSGAKNQGKLFVSNSFQSAEKQEVRWKIEVIDLKHKEYIESLIAYDKRADEVLLSSKGIDASISGISKDGIISKSGSDLYYNYVIYLHNLTTAEETCCEALNQAIRLNFPELYTKGYRIGFYNEVPQRQEDIPPKDRIQNQDKEGDSNANN